MLVRCLYASRATNPESDGVLDSILKQSRKNNAKNGITGMLCFSNGVFVQVIEGGRAEASRLMSAIIRDERNIDVEILSFEEITERRFGNWNMGQVNIATINPAVLLKYSEKPELNPFACNAHVTMALLSEIAASGSIVHRSA
jgi:Sensors of blue-light using FAD